AGDPHRAFTWMRRHDPVYFDESGGLWGIALHEDVTEISRRPELFCSSGSSRPDAPPLPSMINLDDPQHLRRRGLVNRGFTPRRVADHEPAIRALCRELIEAAAAKGRCDFVAESAAPLPMALIGDLLGVEPADRGMLQRWSDDLIAATSLSASAEAAERAMRAFVEYSEYNRAVVAERRARPRQDLMSVLIHAEIEGERLSDAD